MPTGNPMRTRRNKIYRVDHVIVLALGYQTYWVCIQKFISAKLLQLEYIENRLQWRI